MSGDLRGFEQHRADVASQESGLTIQAIFDCHLEHHFGSALKLPVAAVAASQIVQVCLHPVVERDGDRALGHAWISNSPAAVFLRTAAGTWNDALRARQEEVENRTAHAAMSRGRKLTNR